MSSIKQQMDRLLRGATRVVSPEELEDRLKKGKPLRIKLGVDPTSPDLHLGHTVVLNKLRIFQDLGHQVVFIVGDFTASIGDPSGRDATRPPLTDAEIKANTKTYTDQIFKILNPKKTEVRFNSEWLLKLFDKDAPAFLPKSLLRRYTVQQLMERDDFTERRKAGQPISLLELLYPLFQGADSVAVKADVELGGNDQIFNLLMGRQLQKDAGQLPQVVLTMPLLEGLDGVRKMSKSYENHVGLQDAPSDMFGKIMSISDAMMWTYYTLLTEEPLEPLRSLHPKEVKLKLAERITARYHGEKKGAEARRQFESVFSEGENPADMENFSIPKGGINSVDLLVRAHLAASKKEAKRLIDQGGVRLGDRKLDSKENVLVNEPVVLKVGKRRFCKLIP